MKIALFIALLAACLPGGARAAESSAHTNRAPNVIIVLTDDQGYGDVACLGNRMIRTPNLDRLHAESVRLTNFHVDPTCAPTRAALMTGRYSTRTGVWHTIMGRSLMYRDEVTMADVFKSAGYRTAMFGKWHLGDNYPLRPEDRGFEETVTFGGGGIGQTPDHWGNDYIDDTYRHNGRLEKCHGYCTDVFFSRALQFIEANKDRPFFAYIATNVPHAPYIVPERYTQPYTEKGVPRPMDSFYGMIANMDENLGRLRARLQELGLAENTILIFASDNGTAAGVAGANRFGAPPPPPGSWPGFNAGMRGVKGSEYDGGHRTPCFIRWPRGGVEGGRDVNQLTAHIDLLPTLIDLCRLPKPSQVQFDGTSLAALLRDPAAVWPERTLFVHRQRADIPPKWEHSAVMTDRWRYNNGRELYDITRDPGQEKNVAADHPDVVAKLRARYETWWASLAPALKRFAYIEVGAPQENPTMIDCMDWHAPDQKEVPWNQEQIKEARWVNGYWMIEVAKPGRYAFTLRQEPAEAHFRLQANRARIIVGDQEASVVVPAGATSVTLSLKLRAGPAKMQTWLSDDAAGKSRGAFYVEARLLE
ncbi:arylsulfatase [Horticoccus luteus]|uniref:Arylsulfatase n=2 Tax=Horticoccus luteus TaxID=2862869 RepID=A0A8F9TT74_9BACT|nr:arylsulfatase [Horticoccus luteus]